MTKVLILCAHRPGRSPSQRYRFEQYLPFLRTQGFSFTFSYLLNERDDRIFYSRGRFFSKMRIMALSVLKRLRDCLRFGSYDIVLIQREASFLGTSFAEKRAFGSGARVIFDFDDSIWLADTSPGNKKWEWIKKPEKFFRNISYAHYVIAGNEWLAEKARAVNKNTIVIPTTIDTAVHVPMPEKRGPGVVTIGWSGSISTIKHFEQLVPVLARLKKKYGDKVRVRIIGDKDYSHKKLEITAVAWSKETEVMELNTFDIGVMPLPDDEWARGKCGLKGLSYMACGVATVMSPVGVNREIINDTQNGILAMNEEDWFVSLALLIENKELREKLGKAGRQTVVERYSVPAHKQKYLDLFNEAAKRR